MRTALIIAASTAVQAQSCRDRFLWPFSQGSVWNMPIGSSAQFVPAGIYAPPYGPPASFHNDQDFAIRASAQDPETVWNDQGDWSGGDKCQVVNPKVATTVPFPANFSTSCVLNNNAAALLLPDNISLIQMQPLYRAPGGPILARYKAGCPVPFPFNISILSDGALGAHGGSGLSSIGGTIRSGELAPTAGPIRHALKLELFAHLYYYGYGPNPAQDCFTWPATGCDGYAHTCPSGQCYMGNNSFVKPGALLAIPAAVAPTVVTATIPGRLIKDALTGYGGYLVDDTADDTAAICMESVVTQELQQWYNINVDIGNPAVPGNNPTGQFYQDLVNIFSALQAVTNNGPNTVGGGGQPLRPLAPPICD